MGIRSVAVYSEADRYSAHVTAADSAVALEGNTPGETYLRGDLIIAAATSQNVEAIIPGYGFLSENSDFAVQCEAAGICFIGPTPEQMHQLGLKHIAYEVAASADVPLLPHSGLLTDIEKAKLEAKIVGYPVILKSTAGAGGMGIMLCTDENQLVSRFSEVKRAATKFYSDDGVYLERYIDDARHIEVQIFGDGHGHVIALNERDCSLQRRHQKIVEETPPPNLSDEVRVCLRDAAVRLGTSVKYRSAGTVEFVYDRTCNEFYFLEVNCRLQVEHPVTELVYGIDLVEWMVSLAAGQPPRALYSPPIPKGVAIEVRLCSEEPLRNFEPSSGTLSQYQPNVVEVLAPGTYTTIQDYPGRVNHWDVGVPPSGPMDDYAFRLANRLVGNAENAAALECTLVGPSLRFHASTIIAITGATMSPMLDGISVDLWEPIPVKAGQILKLEKSTSGCRTYIAVQGGFDVPIYLGSRSTFVLGKFGGYAGRILKSGDMLFIDKCISDSIPSSISDGLIPQYPTEDEEWEVGVLYGPHGAPDFFMSDYIDQFFDTIWQVHHNSNRLGVRLLGPKPAWSRSDGGEAGLHPSNIHDCEYAVGSINFTGDTPIILTQDGPSLGGFVCLVTIAKAELWKIGQVKPNDRIRFFPITFDQALALEHDQDKSLATLTSSTTSIPLSLLSSSTSTTFECILAQLLSTATRPTVVYRQAGDHYILIEYGAMQLDLRYRFRVHLLMEELRDHHPVNGILELAPGVRSLQIRYDSRVIHQQQLLAILLAAEFRLLTEESDICVKSRIIYLPLAFEDSATLDAVKRYRETVKQSAPWLPNNVDFIQRINGLPSRDDVLRIVFDASYLVLGLGDVYLGAPCAVPIDPRHRLLTSKYNPARTFTAEGTVGIGGVYMCIYGMDSPGGYQLIGRTLPIWNTFTLNTAFEDGHPWLLRFFDQVRFYPVDEKELSIQRDAFREGRLSVRIVHDNVFNLGEYNAFLKRESESIANFTAKQAAAFAEEVSHWELDDYRRRAHTVANGYDIEEAQEAIDGQVDLTADICGSVWKILVEKDGMVEMNALVITLEAMKMEFTVRSPIAGRVCSVLCHTGQLVAAGDVLLRIEPVEQ
ncbi:unnamed protein product [Rotaria sordida]|uniref:Urea carboxylase n=1 Tax=Rotaria sordida TaxID=392033 RepID=A0A814E933_9BILA|nr:unnamed protein product [Rotaria sordida]CAF1119678.1 unnamed protein product [Rotaria sordida]CAF1120742.1 unnamed protein product [Rotaria sordida]CAF1338250.1 unnamed protein product [Rotaria sordida]CAF3850899.1 unnamed protein product [Rotaria sordida]